MKSSLRLEARWPQSRRRGRPGTPAELVIRMLILKHLFDWSYDDLECEVRASLGPEVIEQLHRHLVDLAKRAGVTHGRRFRIDTTVVETNVHYPTDSVSTNGSHRTAGLGGPRENARLQGVGQHRPLRAVVPRGETRDALRLEPASPQRNRPRATAASP